MRVLFIGDVVGSPGRRGLREAMPALREQHAPDLIVVNGENSAGGVGITETHRQRPLRRRRRRDHHRQPRLPPPRGLRLPRTRAAGDPARPTTRTATPAAATPWSRPAGCGSAVINLSGAVGLKVARSPFDDRRRHPRPDRGRRGHRRLPRRGDQREGGDGLAPRRPRRRGASAPTPTCRPPTAGCCPKGTAFISDVGMTGSRTSVLGVKPEQALAALITQMPTRFETAEEDVWVMGAAGRGQRAGAGGLVRAGDGAGSVHGLVEPRLARSCQSPPPGDQQQRVEPDDVEVEPVVHGQLERDQQGRAEGRDLDQGLARGAGRRGRGRAPRSRRGSRCAAAPATGPGPRC